MREKKQNTYLTTLRSKYTQFFLLTSTSVENAPCETQKTKLPAFSATQETSDEQPTFSRSHLSSDEKTLGMLAVFFGDEILLSLNKDFFHKPL